jgi:hypothetical protein
MARAWGQIKLWYFIYITGSAEIYCLNLGMVTLIIPAVGLFQGIHSVVSIRKAINLH